MVKKFISLLLLILAPLVLISCLEADFSNVDHTSATSLADWSFPEDFDWSDQLNLQLKVNQSISEEPVSITLFEKNDDGSFLAFSTFGLKKGETITETISLSKNNDTIYFTASHPLFMDKMALPVTSTLVINLVLPHEAENSITGGRIKKFTSDYYETLGGWDHKGKPDYLVENDLIEPALIPDINASLPENRPVPEYNPEYLNGVNLDSKIMANADVWITFVSEGAGWRNALGFYTYDLNNPPTTQDEIQDMTLVFPNASLFNGGGSLYPGNKVYLGRFQAGTGIGWFLVPNGWNGNDVERAFADIKFSNHQFNTFTSQEYAQHFILLKDAQRELILMGVEDTSRPSGDNDFNDALFYISSNPYTAIETEELVTVKKAVDSDGDGIYDHDDEFPNDPDAAYKTIFPINGSFYSLAYEDMWPNKGDYDFNDLVIDFKYVVKKNKANQVISLNGEFLVRAIGAGNQNGFALALDCKPTSVFRVSGTKLSGAVFDVNVNGTEAGTTETIIPLFDNAFDLFEYQQNGFINTELEKKILNPAILNVNIEFSKPIPNAQLGDFPLNPFLVVAQNRGREVHLPGFAPTPLASLELFGTGDDGYHASSNKYYLSNQNLPWAIQISESFDYPMERIPIHQGHLKFVEWAQNKGSVYSEWFKNKSNYRNTAKLFKSKKH